MKITQLRFYDGARERVCRLGLADLLLELQDVLLSAEVHGEEGVYTEHVLSLYSLIDGALEARGGWERRSRSGIDWVREFRYNQTFLSRLGVELQVPSRTDMSIGDVTHLRYAIIEGLIDVGVVVVPDDRLQVFLPDRTPAFRDAVRYIEEEFKEAMNYPFVIVAIEHDAPGDALPKQPRKS